MDDKDHVIFFHVWYSGGHLLCTVFIFGYGFHEVDNIRCHCVNYVGVRRITKMFGKIVATEVYKQLNIGKYEYNVGVIKG